MITETAKKHHTAYMKIYYENPEHEKKHREQDKEYQRKKRALNPENKRIETKEYCKKYPERIKARVIARYYIKRGKIKKQPCEICGNKKTQAHHEDYNKPLEVRWLCPSCHKKLHLGLLVGDKAKLLLNYN
jgi:ribosomal protein S27AE